MTLGDSLAKHRAHMMIGRGGAGRLIAAEVLFVVAALIAPILAAALALLSLSFLLLFQSLVASVLGGNSRHYLEAHGGAALYFPLLACVTTVVALAQVFARRLADRLYSRFKYRHEADAPAPVLFLREFSSDAQTFSHVAKGSWLLPTSLMSRLDLRLGIFLARLLWIRLGRSSVEWEVYRRYNSAAPVIAIGRPSEPIAAFGAQRFYVPDSKWQHVVGDFLDCSGLVVLRLGQTKGIDWELRRIAEVKAWEKTVLVLVDETGEPYRDASRAAALARLKSEFGIDVRAVGAGAKYVVFQSARNDAGEEGRAPGYSAEAVTTLPRLRQEGEERPGLARWFWPRHFAWHYAFVRRILPTLFLTLAVLAIGGAVVVAPRPGDWLALLAGHPLGTLLGPVLVSLVVLWLVVDVICRLLPAAVLHRISGMR